MSLSALSSYVELAKLKIASLNVLVAAAAMILASQRSVNVNGLIILVALGFLGAGGSGVLNCYVEKDLDSLMERTKRRALPSGRIRPPEKAALLGVVMITAAVTFAWLLLNPLTSAFIGLGALIYVGVYTLWLKRRTPWNIVIGGAAGSCAPLAGWAAATNMISLPSASLAILIFLWTPGHFWALAIANREAYAAARIPMMPVLVNLDRASRRVLYSNLILLLFTPALVYANTGGLILTISLVFMGGLILYRNVRLLKEPNSQNAWLSFKASTPYLMVTFLAMLADTYVTTFAA